MPLKIRKAIKLDQNDPEDLMDYSKLCLTTVQIGLAEKLMAQAKELYMNAMTSRQQIINALLLDKYELTLGLNDTVQFYDQTGELKIFTKTQPQTSIQDETE